MNIYEAKEYSNEIHTAVNMLLPQLSKSTQELSRIELNSIISSEATMLFVAEESDQIFGMLTLVVFKIPTGVRAWIEDVVVGENARGKGVGKFLTEHAVEMAYAAGAKSIDLTSRPEREAANALYKRVGFEERQTNVYRHRRT